MKKELAIGICFGLAGILCTCLFGYEYFTTYGFLNAYHMKAFAASDTGYLPLLANILWERGKVFVIIAILSLTALKAILPLLLRCLIYFTGGVFFAACLVGSEMCIRDRYGDSWNCFFSGIVAAAWNFVSCSACAFTAGRTAQVL